MPTRQEILDKLNNNPTEFTPAVLANVIKSRDYELTVADLYDLNNFPKETIVAVRSYLFDFENKKFDNAYHSGNPQDLNNFIKEFRNGRNVEEAKKLFKIRIEKML